MNRIPAEAYIHSVDESRRRPLFDYHNAHLSLFNNARGSGGYHQNWPGGYRDHLEQAFALGTLILDEAFSYTDRLHEYDQTLSSLILVLYYHDIEKMFKYSTGLPEGFDKDVYLETILPVKHLLVLTAEELSAIKFIHGESDDLYQRGARMGGLAAIAHAADIVSARFLKDYR